MRLSRVFILAACWGLLGSASVHAQTWGSVTGTVTDSVAGEPLPGITVLVQGTDFGTATTADGDYRLELPTGRYALRFSAIGFATHVDSVTVTDGATRLDVTLAATVLEMDELMVTEGQAQRPGVYEVDPADVQNMPTPFKDGFRALKTMPGVATNSELTQQYSVRGGGYNENLVFINGFEIFFPFRPRQGEQEGMGLLNPALASDITFYTGGFPPEYGGKLSSALDVQYAQPGGEGAGEKPLSGSVDLSTLDASAHLQSSALGGDLGWALGMRRAQPGRFFGTQDLKGDYSPRFTDVQGTVEYRVSDRVSVEALGIWADNTFELEPEERTTYFGVISLDPERPSDFKALQASLSGARTDGYTTTFGGVRLRTELSDRLTLEHDVAHFSTGETESFDIQSDRRVCQVDPTQGANPANCFLRGESSVTRFADNVVNVRRRTARGRYELDLGRQTLKGGWHLRDLRFDDQLEEKTIIQGTDQGTLDPVRIRVDSLTDQSVFNEQQFGAHLQDAVDVLPTQGRLTVTGGLRADYFSFNDEWTVSPRLSTRFGVTDRLTLTGAWGIYHQKPTYRELRGSLEGATSIEETLNRDIESQRSVQYVLGGEYFFPEQRLYLRAEAYYKDLDNLISYTIEDVRVNYSGENDTYGYTYGLDLQVRGELVPGLESWFNYSYLVARERFTEGALGSYTNRLRDARQGRLPRPADQRHTFSAFVQDYVPGDESWKVHMRLLYGSGLPYTPTNPGPEVADGVQTRVPADRMSGRLPSYRRVDVGATKRIEVVRNGIGGPVHLELTLEVLNLFDMDNTVDYSWTRGFERVPKRLTPRTLNARLHLTF
ncbi:TonB-dependent receptor [Salinibacter altiplanensis]|uniref:TonB-dependent receptor n=1 Tax=Salinibacter altiplanensis TaxID=1803181 RepID=UPI000C9F210F|nr:TonB-dependent receptor [Salinibacter altiplanensis]